MRKLIITLAAGIVAATAALVLFAVFHKTYDDYANECANALAQHAKGKPAACKEISKDDYDLLRMAQALHDTGAVDDEGNAHIGQ